MKLIPAFLFLSAAACSAAIVPVEEPAPEEKPEPVTVTSSRELIREMHDRYADNWYRSLSYTQNNTFYTQSGGEQKSRWIHHLSVPGRLRIDFEPLSSKSGMLIVNNRVTTFDNGRRIDSRRSIQALLTLTADVYAIPPAVTIRRLDSLRIDLEKFRTDKLNRKKVFVIGADEGDLESNQVWIDADRMLLLRLIQKEKRGERTIVTDTRIGDYKDVDGYPIPHEFVATRDGKPYFREEYEKVRVNQDLPAGIFDPLQWSTVRPNIASGNPPPAF